MCCGLRKRRATHSPLRHIIGAMLNAAVRLALVYCANPRAENQQRRLKALPAMRGVLPRKAQSARRPWLAHINKARCCATPRHCLPACARRRCARHKKPCRARGVGVRPLPKDPSHVRHLKMAAAAARLPFPFLVATPRPQTPKAAKEKTERRGSCAPARAGPCACV